MFDWLPAFPPAPLFFAQLFVGLINGAFYAMLSLGLAVIFGLLNIINFTHGAQYMLGAFCAWFLLQWLGIGYWWALLISPIVVGISGIVIERVFLRRIARLDHLYGLLLTFGLALVIEGCFRQAYGSSGQPYTIPPELQGARNLGFMFLPNYRAWVIVASLAVCFATWFVIERTRLGAYLRAATENPTLVQAFGIDVPRMVTLTYGAGVGLAALAGVMAAPIYQVSPLMGSNIITVVFAVVVIGGMGSILGAIVSGFGLGLIEGLTKVFYPEASNTIILSGGLEHDHLRDHGDRAAGQASRPVRTHGMRARAANKGAILPSPSGREGAAEGHHGSLRLPDDVLRFARGLRTSQTDAEARLWLLLRDRRLAGWKFRRQHPIPPYIVDFYCDEAKLVIELDGGQHAAATEDDIRRMRVLKGRGLRLRRYWNNDMLTETEVVLQDIWNALHEPSPLTPLPEGERNFKCGRDAG
jgi:branched-chain amino acid transport system permease protein